MLATLRSATQSSFRVESHILNNATIKLATLNRRFAENQLICDKVSFILFENHRPPTRRARIEDCNHFLSDCVVFLAIS